MLNMITIFSLSLSIFELRMSYRQKRQEIVNVI